MTDPIEAVARALFSKAGYGTSWDGLIAISAGDNESQSLTAISMLTRHRMLARAAIAAFLDAVREPSANAKDAGTEVLYGEDFVGNPKASTTAMETWQAMIDALRAELLPPPGDA